MREVYATREGTGEIRRVNINAAPFDVDGFRTIREAGIGTYQVFQETYHHGAYARAHPAGTRKGDYRWRLSALDRAMMAGCDDVGLGALFGLHDWRFEVLGLVRHALHLQERFGVGPHTISFPRLQPASGVHLEGLPLVDDDDFLLLIAVLRLAVPYTGLILTAREHADLRRAALAPRRLADRRRHPPGTGRLRRARGAALPGARPVRPRRHSLAGRSDARAGRRRLPAQLLHRVLPQGPHRRALHGVRHPRLHQALLHAQRADHAAGVPDRLRRARHAHGRRGPDCARTRGAAGRRRGR
ncbi:MAG: hypothetical protein IPG61_19670 [bacterium]|nr:hypothetical protein [bacterium]